MARRVEGLKDAEWKLLEAVFPGKDRRSRGMPAAHPRKILNSLLWLLITGIEKRKPSLAQSMAS